MCTVGGSPKRKHGPWDPLNGTGDDFWGGAFVFLSVSNDFSEENVT